MPQTQPIMTNGDGTILMTVGGRPIKAGYNWGNSLKLLSATQYVNVKLPILSDFTIMGFLDNNDLTTNKNLFNVSNGLTQATQLFSLSRDNAGRFYFHKDSHATFIGTVNSFPVGMTNTRIFFAIARSGNNYRLRINNTFLETTASCIDATSSCYLRIGFGWSYSNTYGAPLINYNEINVFTRYLSAGEINYYYANNLGSELQSTASLFSRLIYDKFEILDFSATQNNSDLRVGLNDVSGNFNHGQIIGLAAGSLTDQMNWANNNLIVV